MDAVKSGVDANEALKKATGSYGRFREAVSTIDPRKERTMALFQNYDQRIGAVEAFLNMYG